FCPATHATDELFTSLLAQATADALQRARSYDEERAARQTAEFMSHAREQVLGVVAHDLRNPLNLLGMTTQLLAEPDLAPVRRHRASLWSPRLRPPAQWFRPTRSACCSSWTTSSETRSNSRPVEVA